MQKCPRSICRFEPASVDGLVRVKLTFQSMQHNYMAASSHHRQCEACPAAQEGSTRFVLQCGSSCEIALRWERLQAESAFLFPSTQSQDRETERSCHCGRMAVDFRHSSSQRWESWQKEPLKVFAEQSADT